jgi:hypothetical protein
MPENTKDWKSKCLSDDCPKPPVSMDWQAEGKMTPVRD